MREWEYTKGYSVGGLIFQLGDPVESNERLADFAFATTTVQRERTCDLYKVSDLAFALSDTENKKELEVWGANVATKDLITEGLYTEELYINNHVANRTFGEITFITETYSPVWIANRAFLYTARVKDTVSSETMANYGENVSIADSFIPVWFINRTHDESINIEEKSRWTLSRIFSEIAVFFDRLLQRIIRLFTDKVTIQSAYSWGVNKEYYEYATINDFIRKGIRLRSAEAVNISDKMTRKAMFNFAENVRISDRLYGGIFSLKKELLRTSDEGKSFIKGNYKEQAQIAIAIKNQWNSYRTSEEPVDVSDKIFSTYKDNIGEIIRVKDVRIRPTTNGILSNIIISEKEMSYEDFQKNADQIAGYAPFVEFKVGDYEYKNAVYRMVLSRSNINSTPLFYGYEVHVDIPDTIDRGECAVSGETKVYFNKHYYHAPEINVTTTGGTEVLIPRIVSIDNEDSTGRYFTVILENLSGESKSGRISWSARGY